MKTNMNRKPHEYYLTLCDLEETLFSKDELYSSRGIQVIKSNALELLSLSPTLQLMEEGEKVIDYFHTYQIPIGIWSSFAYQYAINFIAASKLRDKIDSSLIGLSHKKAWEEIFGDGPYNIHDKDYEALVKQFSKPSSIIGNELRRKAEIKYSQIIPPETVLLVGDNEGDENAARDAGFGFLYINDAQDILAK